MRVLFVDDDAKLLGSLRRMAMSRKGLDAQFASGGEKALDILETVDIDIVVADMRMPGMDGATLLKHVQERHPDVVRIVLSGHSDKDLVRRSVSYAHQFLSKPFPFDNIMTVLDRVHSLREVFLNVHMRSVVGRIDMLPVLPDSYQKIIRELESKDCSLARIGRIISSDVGLTAGILKVVNSSFFGLSRPISTPEQAVTYLGTDILRGLIIGDKLFTTFDASKQPDMSINLLWTHSLNTALFCRAICSAHPLGLSPDEAFNAGLLHDVGKLILADKLSKEYSEIISLMGETENRIDEVERAVLGVTHAEMGAYLLGLWGLPEPIVWAVAEHHRLGLYPESMQMLSAVVHAANVFEHELVVFHDKYKRPDLDLVELREHGITPDDLERWRASCAGFLVQRESLKEEQHE